MLSRVHIGREHAVQFMGAVQPTALLDIQRLQHHFQEQ